MFGLLTEGTKSHLSAATVHMAYVTSFIAPLRCKMLVCPFSLHPISPSPHLSTAPGTVQRRGELPATHRNGDNSCPSIGGIH